MGLSLIRQCANLLIVGAVAFSTYAKSYNRLFGYHVLDIICLDGKKFGGDTDRKFGYRRLKTLMQDKEENKVKSFTRFNLTCRLESC